MRERTNALRPDDLRALGALYAAIEASGRGRTVFVVGDDAAGRGAFLHDWVNGFAYRPGDPCVIGGSFEIGAYRPWDRDASASEEAIDALKQALSAAQPAVALTASLLPGAVCKLCGQVLSKHDEARQIAAERLLAGDRGGGLDALCDGLRRLCEERPVVCIVECPDGEGGGLLADLVAALTWRVASDLPLLLIVSMDGPQQLGGHERDEPDILNVARQLTSPVFDVATWHWLPALTVTDLACFTGSCAPGMLGLLIQITGGRGGWSIALWRQWRERDIVRDDERAPWRFADGQSHATDVLGEHVDARMRGLVGGDAGRVARARRLLTCATLEGRWVTAPAVAFACDWDVDEAIDFLDDVAVVDAQHPAGLLIEEGFETVRDERGWRFLATYRFARQLDWLMLRHHGPHDGEDIALAGRLARALEVEYGNDLRGMTGTLRRLFAAAGHPEDAGRYQRMSDMGFDRQVIVWRARNLLRSTQPSTAAERRRRHRLLVAASRELLGAGPFDDGLAFARAAVRLAEGQPERAEAERLIANHFGRLGRFSEARPHLEAALRIRLRLGDRRGEATARHELAVIHQEQGDHERAESELCAVLTIRRELGDRRGEAAAQHELAVIDSQRGELPQARDTFDGVLAIHRELGDRRGEAATRHELAVIDQLQGDLARARTGFSTALEIQRELGDRRGEAAARHELAVIDGLEGVSDRARSEFEAVLKIHQELGDRQGQASARHELAVLDREQGYHELAESEFHAVLEIRRELGDRHGEAVARHELALSLADRGDHDEARMEFTAALELFRALGDGDGEAACREELDALRGDCAS